MFADACGRVANALTTIAGQRLDPWTPSLWNSPLTWRIRHGRDTRATHARLTRTLADTCGRFANALTTFRRAVNARLSRIKGAGEAEWRGNCSTLRLWNVGEWTTLRHGNYEKNCYKCAAAWVLDTSRRFNKDVYSGSCSLAHVTSLGCGHGCSVLQAQ